MSEKTSTASYVSLRRNRTRLGACARCTYLYSVPDNVDTLAADTYLSRCSR
jgi:hypothetical protein